MPEPQSLPAMVRAKYPGVYDDISDADLDAKVRSKYPGVYDDLPKPQAAAEKPEEPATSSGLKLAAVRPAIAAAQSIAEHVATSPNITKAGEVAGRLAGGGAGLVTSGHLPAAVAGAAKGGKLGAMAAGVVQKIAAPVATALEAIAPYAQTAATLSGAQSLLNLAQLAEPERKDIGTLGVGASAPVDMAQAKTKTEKSGGYLTKAEADQDVASVKALIDGGAPPAAAVKKISGDNPARFGSLMTLYLRSRQVK